MQQRRVIIKMLAFAHCKSVIKNARQVFKVMVRVASRAPLTDLHFSRREIFSRLCFVHRACVYDKWHYVNLSNLSSHFFVQQNWFFFFNQKNSRWVSHGHHYLSHITPLDEFLNIKLLILGNHFNLLFYSLSSLLPSAGVHFVRECV